MTEEKVNIVKMAYLYASNGEWYKAVEEYKKLLAMDPLDPHVLSMMGDAYAKKGDDAEALAAYRKARSLYEKVGNFPKMQGLDRKIGRLNLDRLEVKDRHFVQGIRRILEADQLAAEGRVDEAVARFRELIEAEPLNFTYREKLARMLLDEARVLEAAEQLRAVVAAHLQEGRLEEAESFLAQLREADPGSYETLKICVDFAERAGRAEEAAAGRVELARAAFAKGLHAETREILARIPEPHPPELRRLAAEAALHQNDFDDAKRRLEDLLSENPEDAEVLAEMLTLEERQKNWPTARDYAVKLLKQRPTDVRLRVRLAKILLQMREIEGATRLYLGLAQESLQEGNLEAVLGHLESVLAFRPDHLEILKKKAELLLKMGRRAECVEAYKALQMAYTERKMGEEARKAGAILAKLGPNK